MFASSLSRDLEYPRLRPLVRRFWKSVKRELYIFTCPWHPDYAGLRKRIALHVEQPEAAIVELISASISSRIGVPTSAITPAVACALLMLLEVGSEAFGEPFHAKYA
jgi:hypothetical protein